MRLLGVIAILLSTLWLFLTPPGHALSLEKLPPFRPTLEEFRQICHEHFAGAAGFRLDPNHLPAVGSVTYQPLLAFSGEQGRFSLHAETQKLAKTLAHFEFDESQNKWVNPEADGEHLFPLSKAVRAFLFEGRLYMEDGHHRLITVIYLGAPLVPVRVIEDYTGRFTHAEFQKFLDEHYLSYFRDEFGRPTEMVNICDMIDDSNLALARMLVGRVEVIFSDHKPKIKSVKDYEGVELTLGKGRERGQLKLKTTKFRRPVLALKVNDDIPFLEFYVADALRRAGVIWDSSRTEPPSDEELEIYLAILHAARHDPNSRLSEVLLLAQPTRVAKSTVDTLVRRHLFQKGCERVLVSRTTKDLAPRRRH